MSGVLRGGGVAVVAAVTLSACAGTPRIGLPTAENVVGTCKDRTTAEEMLGLSDVSPAVACTSPHVLETYAVVPVSDAVKDLGPLRPGPEILAAQSGRVCPGDPIRPYLGATALDSQWGIGVFTKYPTRDEWSGGFRSATCSLVVAAPDRTVPRLETPLRDVMKYTDSARVRQCRDGDGTVVTCDLPHTAERAGDVAAGGDCAAQAVRYVGGPVDPAYTTAVVNGTECWITGVRGTTTGTLRGGLVDR